MAYSLQRLDDSIQDSNPYHTQWVISIKVMHLPLKQGKKVQYLYDLRGLREVKRNETLHD